MRFAIALLAGSAAGCVRGFLAGSLGPAAVQLDCIDVAARPELRSETVGFVIAVKFGNHCDHSVDLDLAKLRVVGRDELDGSVELTPFDPNHEIGERQIDAGYDGEEWIEYRPHHPRAIDWIDVDVGGVEVGRAIEARRIRLRARRLGSQP